MFYCTYKPQTMKAAQDNNSTVGNKESAAITITIEADENTPLLRNSSKHQSAFDNYSNKSNAKKSLVLLSYFDIRVLGIAVLLIGGLAIALHLLAKDSRLPSVGFSLDLVNRDVWSKSVIPLGKLLNNTKGLHVLVVQTGGNVCMDLESCTEILRNMQDLQKGANDEIHYNFLVGGDGQTYEVRGWNHESGLNFLPQQSSLVIGFIGNYTSISPTDVQCTSALSVINEFVQRRKLHSSYQVFGLRNLSISHYDGEALFNRISKWQRFDTLLHVL